MRPYHTLFKCVDVPEGLSGKTMKKEIFTERQVSQILRMRMKGWNNAVTVFNRAIRDEGDLMGEFRPRRFQSGIFESRGQ